MYSILKNGGVCSPKGFLASGIAAGIKVSGNPDMALLRSEKAARCPEKFNWRLMFWLDTADHLPTE